MSHDLYLYAAGVVSGGILMFAWELIDNWRTDRQRERESRAADRAKK